MTTSRARFMQTLDFERADPPWVMLMGGWQETMDLWRTQGWDGRPLEAIFGYDRWLRVDTYYGPAPYSHTRSSRKTSDPSPTSTTRAF